MNNKNFHFLATWVSRIFSPLIIIPGYLLYEIKRLIIGFPQQLLVFLVIFGFGVVPICIALIVLKKTHHITDWNMTERKERHLFNGITLFFGFICLILLSLFFRRIFTIEIFIILIWMTLFTGTTFFWKISAHTIVITYLAKIVVDSNAGNFGWIYGLIPLVAWSRVYNKKHTWEQVIGGVIFAFITLHVTYLIFHFSIIDI